VVKPSMPSLPPSRRAAAECTSGKPGDAESASCEAWCAASDKKYDCTFCMCASCAFCADGTNEAATLPAARVSASIDCRLGVSVELVHAWGQSGSNGGFRLEVIVQEWQQDAEITLEWSGPPPTVGPVFAASKTSTSDDGKKARLGQPARSLPPATCC
ncbi:MAG: hypothetical protein SGPRY_011281, partial [Prymnesium sp.]